MPSASRSPDVRGDFQTPRDLAERVWRELGALGEVGGVIEPTVGHGVFLESAPDCLLGRRWFCCDIEPAHVDAARRVAEIRGFGQARIEQANAFDLSSDLLSDFDRDQPLLAIGNPPWVTSAGQGRLRIQNLPAKSNEGFGLSGLDAMTGRANFDIAEAILIRLLDSVAEFRDVRLAFLIKRSVAMRLSRRLLGIANELSFSRIDAAADFGVAVDAGLFRMRRSLGAQTPTGHVAISTGLGSPPSRRAGFQNERFVEDLDAHMDTAHLEATEPVPWRQGVKHDVAKLLELRQTQHGLENGLGEVVTIESDSLCPLYKGSDLANGRPAGRLFPLYQFDMSGPVPDLSVRWPLLAAYLAQHENAFGKRRSRIYDGKASFAIFGIGPYALAPWKVAVSGLYSSARFRVIGPSEGGHPPLVDDTCYLLPFDSEASARTVAEHLNGPEAQALLGSLMDRDAKRPVTKGVLSRISIPVAPVEIPNTTQLNLSLAA